MNLLHNIQSSSRKKYVSDHQFVEKYNCSSELWSNSKLFMIDSSNQFSDDFLHYLKSLRIEVIKYLKHKKYDHKRITPVYYSVSKNFISELIIGLFKTQNLLQAILLIFPNMLIIHPSWKYLKNEWDYEKNHINPNCYSYGSSHKLNWICSNCNNEWMATLRSRTEGNQGCLKCYDRERAKIVRLGKLNEENKLIDHEVWRDKLKDEWDYEKNSEAPENYSYGSKQRIHWICRACGHNWDAVIVSRTMNERGCLECYKRKQPELSRRIHLEENEVLSNSYRWEGLLKFEWDYRKNKHNPDDYITGSGQKVHWICKHCQYNWEKEIRFRVGGSDCPACNIRKKGMPIELFAKLREDNSLTNHPRWDEILKYEWDYKNNQLDPKNFTYGTDTKAFWICSKCNRNWETRINLRTGGSGCRKCNYHNKPKLKNNKLTEHPEWNRILKDEWDWELNDKVPTELTYGSRYEVFWNCSKCENKWSARVYNRTRGSGCPKRC